MTTLMIPGCEKSREPNAYEFHNRSCERMDAVGIAAANKRAAANGRKLAAKLKPHMWILAEARADPNGDYLWLGKTMPVTEWGDDTCIQKVESSRSVKVGGRSVRFDKGDVKIAVQWYSKLAGETEQSVWMMDAPGLSIMNSTELLLINAKVKRVGGPRVEEEKPVRRRSKRRAVRVETAEEREQSEKERQEQEQKRKWALDPASESVALAEIRSIGG